MATEDTPLLLHNNNNNNSPEKDENDPDMSMPFIISTHHTQPVVILILDVSVRRFELVALARTVRVAAVLELLPSVIVDEQLRTLKFTGLVEPHTADRYGAATYLPPAVSWWVALTPRLTASQAVQHATQVVKDAAVQATVRVDMERSRRNESWTLLRTHVPYAHSFMICPQLKRNGVDLSGW